MLETTAEPIDDPQGVSPGSVIGGCYRVIHLVGEGGMGRVFLAEDIENGTKVALKVLTDDRPIYRAAERFAREAQSIGRIENAHVVSIFDVGESPRGGLFYVMEYLEGEELADTLEREGALGWRRAREITLQVCSGMQAAHEKGVVHRDLKPENCFRVEREGYEDFIKILDFGVAKLLGPDTDSENSGRLTNTGATLGTPVYMAPEQCRGKDVDHRVDIYAVGVLLYEMLTGHPPFDGEGFLDVALMHMNDAPVPLADQLKPEDLPNGLEEVVARALAKAREDRFPTMAAFARSLAKVGEDEPMAIGPAPDEFARMPITAPGGTEPFLDTGPIAQLSGPAPQATMPVLGSMDDYEPDDDGDTVITEVRARWPAWFGAVLGSALVFGIVGLVLWWQQSDGVDPPPSTESSAVDVDTEEPTPHSSDDARSEGKTPPSIPADESSGTSESGSESESESVPESKSKPAPTEVTPPRRGLTTRQINKGIRGVKTLVSACAGGLTKVPVGQQIHVTVKVDRSSGRVIKVKAHSKGGNSAADGCVEDAVYRAEFPATGSGFQDFKRVLTL